MMLIGQNSVIACGPSFLGMRTTLVEFSKLQHPALKANISVIAPIKYVGAVAAAMPVTDFKPDCTREGAFNHQVLPLVLQQPARSPYAILKHEPYKNWHRDGALTRHISD
jgi:hypothetical protein